ncbi:MAG: hypothetical protein K9N35_08245 [Candidatus Marinimicrobia bacterium]|nr:hypothetical protein [Candidatus Neomarinimicrobiota bacterium]
MKVANFTWAQLKCITLILGSILFLGSASVATGQESDSLLFGDEFDLGEDDASFDFGDEGDFNFDEAEDTETGEDDFFGDFGEEADATDVVEDSTAATDDWGLDNETGDIDKLITRTVDGEEITYTPDEDDHPLDFSKYVKGTILEDTGFTLSLYSPQYVGTSLDTWYSYLDFSFTSELPWHFTVYPVDLSFMIDISSFNFDNSFPAGGTFKGVSFMPIARAEIAGVEIEVGAGMYYPTFGALAGIGYSYKFHSLFASAGYRWNWVSNIDPIGSSWWLEPRFTAGIKLW